MLCRVYNDNVHPYVNTFKGEKITIPSKGYIILARSEAVQLKSLFLAHPATFDGSGNQKPESKSMLRVVPVPNTESVVEEKQWMCHATGEKFDTEAQLKAYIKENEDLAERNRLANKDDENVQEDLRQRKRNKA